MTWFIVALIVAVYSTRATLPSYDELKSSPNGQMIRVHAADGTVIISLGPSFGAWLPYSAIPKVMTDAMVSVEDRRYRWHPGVDPLGIARSMIVRVEKGHFTQGGSTITQQLARNVFLTNDKTWTRKIREIILALALERKFSKDQVLELYLNQIALGRNAFGVEAAANAYFDKSVRELTIPQFAYLAILPKGPSNYMPERHEKRAIERRNVVLDQMVRWGRLDPAAAKSASVHAVTYNEADFRYALNEDAMATEKLAEGIRGFAADAIKLDKMIEELRK